MSSCFHHLFINLMIPEFSFLLLQVSGLLASYEKTTCKCVMEVITYWCQKHKNTQRLDKLLIESPAPSPPLLWLPGLLASILTRVLKVPANAMSTISIEQALNWIGVNPVYCIHPISVTSVKIQFAILGPRFCNLGCHFLSPQVHDKILRHHIRNIDRHAGTFDDVRCLNSRLPLRGLYVSQISRYCLWTGELMNIYYMQYQNICTIKISRYQDIVYGQVNWWI